MSVLPLAKRSMRIIAVPLTTASRTPDSAASGHLTYFHFITPPPKEEEGTNWLKWTTGKAADLWAGFGKAEDGTWKRKTFVYGERLVDRMDFEELALKSLDPSLGPKLIHFSQPGANVKPEEHPTIPLIYPSTVCSSPLAQLRALLEKRTPRHRRGFYIWMLISPFTAPFMIIPVIPNLPFFFCVWRSWSHYRAYKASAYLEKVLERGAIIPQASQELDSIYKTYAPLPSSSAEPTAGTKKENPKNTDSDASSTPDVEGTPATDMRFILTRNAVPVLAALSDLRPESSFSADVYRALEQARLRMESRKK